MLHIKINGSPCTDNLNWDGSKEKQKNWRDEKEQNKTSNFRTMTMSWNVETLANKWNHIYVTLCLQDSYSGHLVKHKHNDEEQRKTENDKTQHRRNMRPSTISWPWDVRQMQWIWQNNPDVIVRHVDNSSSAGHAPKSIDAQHGKCQAVRIKWRRLWRTNDNK